LGAGRGVLLGVAGLVLKPTSGILAAGSQAAAYGADFCHLPVSIPVAAEDLSELLDKKFTTCKVRHSAKSAFSCCRLLMPVHVSRRPGADVQDAERRGHRDPGGGTGGSAAAAQPLAPAAAVRRPPDGLQRHRRQLSLHCQQQEPLRPFVHDDSARVSRLDVLMLIRYSLCCLLRGGRHCGGGRRCRRHRRTGAGTRAADHDV